MNEENKKLVELIIELIEDIKWNEANVIFDVSGRRHDTGHAE